MPSQPAYWSLFLTLLLLQLNSIFTACPTGQTPVIIDSQSTCVNQATLTATVRPTTTGFVYYLVFEGGKVPFTSLTDFNSNTVIKLSSTVETLSTSPQAYLSLAIADDLSIIQIVPVVSDIPYGTSMTITFTDFSTDETRPSVVTSPVIFAIPATRELTSSTAKLIDMITDIDYILEIVWIVVAVLNPFWSIYMDSKLYRETLDFIKHVNVQYEPFVSSFYMANDKKISGLRVPNIFSILIFGNKYASEWDKYPQHNIGLNYVNPDRVSDVAVLVNSNIFKFSDFPLFLDNYGSELTFILGIFILILAIETSFKYLRIQTHPQVWARIIQVIRTLLWNFLLLTVLGSCQSLIFYTAVEIQAFFYSTRTRNNIISFALAIAVFLVIIGCLFGYVIWVSKKRVNVNAGPIKPQVQPLTFFESAMDLYHPDKMVDSLYILAVVIRAIALSVLMLTLNSTPLAQTIAMLSVSVVYLISIVAVRPFTRTLYTIFRVIYEVILVLAQAILVVLAAKDDANNFDVDERSYLGVILVCIWIAVPVTTIIFGAVGLLFYVKQEYSRRHGGNKNVKVVPTPQHINVVKNIDKKMTMMETHSSASPQTNTAIFEERKPNPSIAIFKPETNFQPNYNNDSGTNLLAGQHQQTIPTSKNNGPSLLLDEGYRGNAPRKQSAPFDMGNNAAVSKGEQKPLLEGVEHTRSRTKSTFARNEEAAQNDGRFMSASVVNVRKRPFDPIPLKLTTESLRVIDEKGFKSFVENKSMALE